MLVFVYVTTLSFRAHRTNIRSGSPAPTCASDVCLPDRVGAGCLLENPRHKLRTLKVIPSSSLSRYTSFCLDASKMWGPSVILISLLCVSAVSFTSGASVQFHVAPLGDADDFRVNDNALYRNKLGYAAGVHRLAVDRATRSLALVAKGSVVLAIFFLLVRCATYITSSFWLAKTGERRLAEESSCGDEVRDARLFF